MEKPFEERLKARIEKIKILTTAHGTSAYTSWYQACSLAQSVLHDTLGPAHPLYQTMKEALKDESLNKPRAASLALVDLYEAGELKSPRLQIAHEIEGDLLALAQSQSELAEKATDLSHKQVHLAIAAFLAGAALEDSLRRLCDASGHTYDPQKASISKLQSCLYQPSNGVEAITSSENKQITAWGDTRNKADHGRFADITQSEVISLVVGVRAFIDKHLP